jgi:hypothetical protein
MTYGPLAPPAHAARCRNVVPAFELVRSQATFHSQGLRERILICCDGETTSPRSLLWLEMCSKMLLDSRLGVHDGKAPCSGQFPQQVMMPPKRRRGLNQANLLSEVCSVPLPLPWAAERPQQQPVR